MNNMDKIEFNLEKASSFLKVSNEFISELQIRQGKDMMDELYDTITVKLDAMFYSNLADERTLTYYCPRPRFFDWLFRREKKVEWELKVKDLLLNPPKIPDKTKRIYLCDIKPQ
jgi:hypothetical protein